MELNVDFFLGIECEKLHNDFKVLASHIWHCKDRLRQTKQMLIESVSEINYILKHQTYQ